MTALPRRILVVGSWAKEQITLEHLGESSDVERLAWIDTENPLLIEEADRHRVGSLGEIGDIVGFARETGADLVLPTTASPLAKGLVDALDEAGIPAFGPTRAAARLEWDKAWARALVSGHAPGAVPRYEVFDDAAKARRFAESLDGEVAVKPLGLTEGLGVRVRGDQLESFDDVVAYIGEVLAGGDSRVIVEERMVGEELTLQALVDGERLVATPLVQDFKKLLPGEHGPNTASMGSYSAADGSLPFVSEEVRAQAESVMRGTLAAAAAAGARCRGFLYGQFMVTPRGLRLVEYNFRPGDPEWMNTVAALDAPLLDAIAALLAGDEPSLAFRREATVVQYVVPKGYPETLDQVLDVRFDRDALAERGVRTYCSGGRHPSGGLAVGSERGWAFLARAGSIPDAHLEVEEAIATLEGEFFHRDDIGTAAMLRRKTARVAAFGRKPGDLRAADEDDFLALAGLAGRCPPLEPYPPHIYRILLRAATGACWVAEGEDGPEAMVVGLPRHDSPGTYFMWQIGADPTKRRRGLASRILAHAEADLAARGFDRIELTVDPENEPSASFFERNGYRVVSAREDETERVAGRLAVRNFYGPRRHFLLFEKRLAAGAAG